MGAKFADKSAAAYARLVKEYPLSPYADEAKGRLEQMEKPIPQADPVAYARMKYEMENRTKASLLSKGLDIFGHAPDVHMAAKSGTPAVDGLRPTTPANVPVVAGIGAVGATGDVGIQQVTDTSALDAKPDARAVPPAATAPATTAPAATTPAATTPAATAPTGATPAPPAGAAATGTAPAAPAADKPQGQAANATAAPASDTASASDTGKKKKKKKKVTTTPPPAQ
jgi:hypothetical protein